MQQIGYLKAGEQKDTRIAVDMPTADYGVAVSNATIVSNWTWMRITVVGDPSKSGFTVRVYNDASSPISNAYFRWVAIC